MQATVQTFTPKGARRAIICPTCGATYSAAPGDYFMAGSSTPFTCDHENEPVPCDLVERVYVSGHDSQGRLFSASGWVTLKRHATVADL